MKLVPRFQWFPEGFLVVSQSVCWKMFCYFQLIQCFFLIKDFLFSKICFVSPWNRWVRNLRSQNWLFGIFCGPFLGGFLIRNPRDQVHISWPDADDLLSNGLEFDNEVEGPWPLDVVPACKWGWGMAAFQNKNGGCFLKGKVRMKEKVGCFGFWCFFHWENVMYKTLQPILAVDLLMLK